MKIEINYLNWFVHHNYPFFPQLSPQLFVLVYDVDLFMNRFKTDNPAYYDKEKTSVYLFPVFISLIILFCMINKTILP